MISILQTKSLSTVVPGVNEALEDVRAFWCFMPVSLAELPKPHSTVTSSLTMLVQPPHLIATITLYTKFNQRIA